MNLFEFLEEYLNPKNIGEISKEYPPIKKQPKFNIYIHFVISIILLIGYYYLGLKNDEQFYLKKICIISILLISYLAIAFNYKIKPNFNNIGLFGTPINDPFKFSDNINRYNIFLELFLIPRRYISSSIVNFILQLKN